MPKLVTSRELIVQKKKLIEVMESLGIISSALSFEVVSDALFYVRFSGLSKDVVGVKIEIRERTIRFDTYLMPYPESNESQLFEYMLRVQSRIAPLHFEIGTEDAIYLAGSVDTARLGSEDVSEAIASIISYSDELFPKMMAIGFEGRFFPLNK